MRDRSAGGGDAKTVMKEWSALLPLVLSFAALALLWFNVAIVGVVREPDEGTAAHVWQMLMAVQVPLVALFAATWLARAPKQTLIVLVLQALAVVANLATLRYFDL